MTAGYYPAGLKFKIVSRNAYGIRIEFEDDRTHHFINPEQRWLPHAIPDSTHPAKVGDIVTLSDYISQDLFGMTVGFVSAVRTFKSSKKSNGVRQVQLLGIPLKWFAITHFEEYRGLQIFHHIFGDWTNQTHEGPPVPIKDKLNRIPVSKPTRRPIFANQ